MNHLDVDGHEQHRQSPEKIEIIGRPMPNLETMYDDLSTVSDIRVFTKAQGVRNGSERKDVSEKELIDNLLSFCAKLRDIPSEGLNDQDRELHDAVDDFAHSIYFMSHEAYREAINGLAIHHMQWLIDNPGSKLLFAVQDSKKNSSQGQVADSLRSAMVTNDQAIGDRVGVAFMSDMVSDLTDLTKIVIADDWVVSGNLIANDLSHVHQVFARYGISVPIEINLLLARDDQIKDGISTIERMTRSDDHSAYEEPKIFAYFNTPKIKNIYEYKPLPSGAHSSVDYGFSNTLDAMRHIIHRYESSIGEVYMPYITNIIPTYAHNYDS